MKVLIIISNCGVGGSQRVAMHLAEWLNKKSNSSAKIISLKKIMGDHYDMSQYNYEELSSKHIIKQLRSKIIQEKPDVVLSMGVPMAIYTVPACLFTNVKHIISERNDPAHFAGKISTKYLSRFMMKFASGYVFQTKDAQKFYKMTEGKRSTVIPNPLSGVQNMPERNYEGIRTKEIVSVGRLNKQKNQVLLIETFAEIAHDYPEYKLVIWGEGEERTSLENKIKELALSEKVELPGTTDSLFDKISAASAFVLSSDFEGMPNALMEAMALGIPSIATDCPCGGPRDLIQDGENGFLVPVGNKEILKQKLLTVINSSEVQKKLSKNAFNIRNLYSLEKICKRWLEYFELVVEDK